ncbi:hypothetical protein ABMA27_006802 [Loxostege sticticalis]|uniref:Reverse transcriptase domain-containing protein n=1 Tax=Loxostege sticticalis TaxID=481309 RepID=A0ABR3IKJ3_LOXSC
MELRSRKVLRMSLPGGDRRGTPGADAGCFSMRTYILRTYLQITHLETDTNDYLTSLHASFIDKFPEMKDVSRQRVGDQRRAIMRRKLLPKNRIDEIYDQVKTEIQSSHTNTDKTQHNDRRINIEIMNKTYATVTRQNTQTTSNTTRPRMRWNNEYNEAIIRAYYKITKLESNITAYRPLLHQSFIEKFPHLAHLSEQRISDQKRLILCNHYIQEDRLNTIKLEVAKELAESENQNMTPDVESAGHRNSDTTSDTEYINSSSILPYSLDHTPNPSTSTSNVQSIAHTSETNDNNSNTQLQTEDINDANTMETQLISQLQEVLIEYEQMDPETRPKLPKLKENKKLYRLVNLFNTNILQKFFDEDSDITHIHTLLYCSAVVISQQLGYKINTNSTTQRKKFEKPSWQIRLEKDIGALRADIGRLSQYINNNRSRKLIAKVQTILKKNTIHSTHENNNRTPQDVLDTLKQKLALKAHRLARYLKALNRKNDNRLFSNNEKGFYRTLNHNNNSNGDDVLPSEEEVKNYWADLWEKCQDHNEEAQWVKEEEKKWEAIQEMEFGDITKDDIEVITRKTKNWKAAGLDGIQNFWYKKMVVLHAVLAKRVTNLIKGEEELPLFVTKGITHLLPKSRDTSNPSQYRPITCLSTLYKLITSCITFKINKHIEEHGILAEEQKGCRRNHKGCKEQLIIDQTVLKHAQKRNRNLHLTYIDYKKAFDSVPHSWLIRVLQIYKINPTIITFLEDAMTKWKTILSLSNKTTKISTEEVHIRNGIFQGDSLSPLWFCLALNPLSSLLNNSGNYSAYHKRMPITDTERLHTST